MMLLAAGIVSVIFRKIHLPVILGYIAVGFLISPYFPMFFNVEDVPAIDTLSEIGVIIILFHIGLEFDFHKLLSVGSTAIVTALVKMSGVLVVGYLFGDLIGLSQMNCIFLGTMLAISSTVVIQKCFEDLKVTGERYTSLVMGELIMEDLIGVFMMVILASLSVGQSGGESVVSKLLAAADNDVEKAEQGIIFIDEIDKITRKSENASITRDVSGEGVQQALLKILEGTVASVPPQGGRKHPHQEFIQIDTTNILFICGGAFDGIEKTIEARQDTKSIGFGADVSVQEERNIGEVLKDVMPEDFIKYGLIPEFIGRVPIVVTLDGLDEEALIRILKEPKNSLTRQYHKLFELDGVELEFEEDALKEVARKSLERKTGARGLRSIMEKSLMDLMYRTPSDNTICKCIITKDAVDGTGEPEVVHGEQPAMQQNTTRRNSRSRKTGKPETA